MVLLWSLVWIFTKKQPAFNVICSSFMLRYPEKRKSSNLPNDKEAMSKLIPRGAEKQLVMLFFWYRRVWESHVIGMAKQMCHYLFETFYSHHNEQSSMVHWQLLYLLGSSSCREWSKGVQHRLVWFWWYKWLKSFGAKTGIWEEVSRQEKFRCSSDKIRTEASTETCS